MSNIHIDIDSADFEAILARVTAAEAQNQRYMESAGLPLRGFYAPYQPSGKIDVSGVKETWRIDPDEQAQLDELLGSSSAGSALWRRTNTLPTLGRAERYLLAQLIGGEPMMLYSQARQLQGGLSAIMAGGAAATGGALTVAMVGVMVAQEVAGYMEKMQRERTSYLTMVASLQPQLSKEQFDKYWNDNVDWLRRSSPG